MAMKDELLHDRIQACYLVLKLRLEVILTTEEARRALRSFIPELLAEGEIESGAS
jgi:hypothetical protein